MKYMIFAASAFFVLAIAFTVGCNKPSDEPDNSNKPATTEANDKHSHSDHAHGDHHGNGTSSEATIKAALAKLSAEDRASAEKQRICPVSGEPLGSMGTPQKIDVKGQPVWICCNGCKKSLLEDPDKYLAKLKKS